MLIADDGRRGHEPGARPETVLMLIACALAGAVLAELWQRFG